MKSRGNKLPIVHARFNRFKDGRRVRYCVMSEQSDGAIFEVCRKDTASDAMDVISKLYSFDGRNVWLAATR